MTISIVVGVLVVFSIAFVFINRSARREEAERTEDYSKAAALRGWQFASATEVVEGPAGYYLSSHGSRPDARMAEEQRRRGARGRGRLAGDSDGHAAYGSNDVEQIERVAWVGAKLAKAARTDRFGRVLSST